MTDTGAGIFNFDNSGAPYLLAGSTKERWFRFTTLGDGLSGNSFRVLTPEVAAGVLPNLRVDLSARMVEPFVPARAPCRC